MLGREVTESRHLTQTLCGGFREALKQAIVVVGRVAYKPWLGSVLTMFGALDLYVEPEACRLHNVAELCDRRVSPPVLVRRDHGL